MRESGTDFPPAIVILRKSLVISLTSPETTNSESDNPAGNLKTIFGATVSLE